MLFKKKIDRVLKNKNTNTDDLQEKIELEKNDMAALLIAGFITLLPALLIVMAMVLGVFWFFVR